jgi:hypothetical protein
VAVLGVARSPGSTRPPLPRACRGNSWKSVYPSGRRWRWTFVQPPTLTEGTCRRRCPSRWRHSAWSLIPRLGKRSAHVNVHHFVVLYGDAQPTEAMLRFRSRLIDELGYAMVMFADDGFAGWEHRHADRRNSRGRGQTKADADDGEHGGSAGPNRAVASDQVRRRRARSRKSWIACGVPPPRTTPVISRRRFDSRQQRAGGIRGLRAEHASDRPIVVYRGGAGCSTSRRGSPSDSFATTGFTQVHHMPGGYAEWQQTQAAKAASQEDARVMKAAKRKARPPPAMPIRVGSITVATSRVSSGGHGAAARGGGSAETRRVDSRHPAVLGPMALAADATRRSRDVDMPRREAADTMETLGEACVAGEASASGVVAAAVASAAIQRDPENAIGCRVPAFGDWWHSVVGRFVESGERRRFPRSGSTPTNCPCPASRWLPSPSPCRGSRSSAGFCSSYAPGLRAAAAAVTVVDRRLLHRDGTGGSPWAGHLLRLFRPGLPQCHAVAAGAKDPGIGCRRLSATSPMLAGIGVLLGRLEPVHRENGGPLSGPRR